MNTEYYAAKAYLAVERNPELLFSIRNDALYRHLLEHPYVMAALSRAFQQRRLHEPPKTRGEKPCITPQIYELYHAVYYYRRKGESITNACIHAVTLHPDLVPLDWDDPQETLRKRVQRLDAYPSISLKEGFIKTTGSGTGFG